MGEMTNGGMVFWLTTPQVAQLAGCSVNVVNFACRKGELRAVRPQTPQNEGRWMVRQLDAEAWAKARTARAALLAQKRDEKEARRLARLRERSASLGQPAKDSGVSEPGARTPDPLAALMKAVEVELPALAKMLLDTRQDVLKMVADNRKLLLALCAEWNVPVKADGADAHGLK